MAGRWRGARLRPVDAFDDLLVLNGKHRRPGTIRSGVTVGNRFKPVRCSHGIQPLPRGLPVRGEALKSVGACVVVGHRCSLTDRVGVQRLRHSGPQIISKSLTVLVDCEFTSDSSVETVGVKIVESRCQDKYKTLLS